MKIGILEPSDFSDLAIKNLNSIGQVECFDGKNLSTFVKDKTVLFVRLNLHINQELLSSAKSLKYICSPTTGLNHIDTDYCQKKGITIISLKGETRFLSTIRATPEHTLGLIISLRRNYNFAFLHSTNTVWNREPYKGYEVYKSRIGIIGYGRVGKILAGYLKSMGANVAVCESRKLRNISGIKVFKTIEGLIKWSDTIALCANYDASVGQIIQLKHLVAMEDKYFINTARAELTDEAELVKLAQKGHFKGLAIDVITEEQSTQRHLKSLISASRQFNIVLTPHIGGATFDSMKKTEDFITNKLIKHIKK